MTYSTLVGLVEASERIRMELNRHSDPRLTAHTYTDASMLPLWAAISRLPVLIGDGSDSHIHSQQVVPESPKLSPTLPIQPGKVILLPTANEVISHSTDTSDLQSPKLPD